MLKGFRDFILRGNVVDLAVAVIHRCGIQRHHGFGYADVFNPSIAATCRQARFLYSCRPHPGAARRSATPNPLPANYIAPGDIHVGKFLNATITS